MSKLTGIFESLKDLESVSSEEINRYLVPRKESHLIENHLASLVIYPQSVPVSKDTMSIDVAILKAYAYKFPDFFYIKDQKKMIVSIEFCIRFGGIQKTCSSLIEGLKLDDITQIYLKENQTLKLIGTAITRYIPNSQTSIPLFLNDLEYKVTAGTCMHYPLKDHHIRFHFGTETEKTISGGTLGVIVFIKNTE